MFGPCAMVSGPPMTRRRFAPNCTCLRPWRLAVWVAVLSATTGCQWVFGDYATDPNMVVGCKDGETACVPNSKELNVCKDGEWVSSRECVISCKRDRCIDCEAEAARCSDDQTVFEFCSNGAWVTQTCADGEYCGKPEAGGLSCVECERDTCTIVDGKAHRAVCAFEGRWSASIECSAAFNECRYTQDGLAYCVECANEGYTCTTAGYLWVCENGKSREVKACGAGNCDAQNARCIVEPQ